LVDTIIFHLPGDIERAQWLAKAWDDRRGVALPIDREARPLQFGPHVFVLGVLTPGHAAADVETLVRTVAQARPRGVIMAWNGAPTPEVAAGCGVPVIAGTSEPADDIDLLRQIARAIERGLFIPSDYTSPPPERAARAAAAPVQLAVVEGRTSDVLLRSTQPPRTRPRPQRGPEPRSGRAETPQASRKGVLVFALGAVLIGGGIAVAGVLGAPYVIGKLAASGKAASSVVSAPKQGAPVVIQAAPPVPVTPAPAGSELKGFAPAGAEAESAYTSESPAAPPQAALPAPAAPPEQTTAKPAIEVKPAPSEEPKAHAPPVKTTAPSPITPVKAPKEEAKPKSSSVSGMAPNGSAAPETPPPIKEKAGAGADQQGPDL
jgi:hypothetical protein